MAKFENIIPFLKKEYEKELSNDNFLDEDVDLFEDKIPKPLLKAYNRNWDDNGTNMSRDIVSRYGVQRQFPDHAAIKNNNSNRHNINWDFGNAHYNKISKQEAADLLGMKIYSGKGKDKVEISINDDIPEDLTIKLDIDKAKQNISKLRFLVKENKDDWRLTEFEYRSENAAGKKMDQFFPIYRDYFSSSKLDDIKIDYRKTGPNARVKDFIAWNNSKTVYYAIKIADLIYETDEYEHTLGIDRETRELLLRRYEPVLWGYFGMKVVNEYLTKFANKFDLDINSTITDLLNNHNIVINNTNRNLMSLLLDTENLNKLSMDMDAKDLLSIVRKYPVNMYWDTGYKSAAKEIVTSILSELDSQQKSWFEANYTDLMLSDLDGVRRNDYSKLISDLQDEILKEIPDDRVRAIWTRRTKNDNRITTRLGKKVNWNNNANDGFHPYDDYVDNRANMSISDIPDTGDHKVSRGYGRSYLGYSGNDDDLNVKMVQLSNLLRDRKKFKKRYILALNNYNQVKKQKELFNDDFVDDELEVAKNNYLDAKAEYLGGKNSNGVEMLSLRDQIQKLKTQVISKIGYDANKNRIRIENFLNKLQTYYSKIIILRRLVKDISSYTKADFEKLYGFTNKKEFEELCKKMDDLVKTQKEKAEQLNSDKIRLENLKKELEELTNKIASEETDVSDILEQINTLQKEKGKLNRGIESSIKSAYQDQAEFAKLATKLDDEAKRYGKGNKNGNAAKKDADDRLLKLIKEFSNTPDMPDEEPDEDDILMDNEENNKDVAEIQ